MSAKENNSEVAVEKGAEEKAPAEKCDLKGTKRPSEDKTPEAKKYRKEENGGGGEREPVDFVEDEEPELEEEDDEEDIGDAEEDELEGEDEELEEEDMGAEEEDEDA